MHRRRSDATQLRADGASRRSLARLATLRRFGEAVKAGPDHEVSQRVKVVEDYMAGIGLNWKAWEREE